MTNKIKAIRGTALLATAGLAVAGAVSLTSSGAGADPGDPVTGGQTTIAVTNKAIGAGYSQGIAGYAESPATNTYDRSAGRLDYNLPVTGGNGSERNGYGSIKHGGRIEVLDRSNRHSVELENFSYSFETGILSARANHGKLFDLASVHGSMEFMFDPTTGDQDFKASELLLDAAGARVLNNKLGVTTFAAGQRIGSFETKFQNTQY